VKTTVMFITELGLPFGTVAFLRMVQWPCSGAKIGFHYKNGEVKSGPKGPP
jgi:hypothetical protein